MMLYVYPATGPVVNKLLYEELKTIALPELSGLRSAAGIEDPPANP
jgi:hypothetical protein